MQINKNRKKKGEITMDTKDIQTTFRSYFENLYSTKFENSKEVENFWITITYKN